MVDDGGVALTDTGRLQDHQVVSGGLARGHDAVDIAGQFVPAPGGERPEEEVVAVERVHPDAVAEQRATAAPAGRVDGEDRDAQFVLLVRSQPAHQFVGERGFPRTAGARDAEDRHRARRRGVGEGLPIGGGQGALLETGDRARQGRSFAREHGVEHRGRDGEVVVAVADQPVDHARQAEPLSVLGEKMVTPASARRAISSSTITPPPPP